MKNFSVDWTYVPFSLRFNLLIFHWKNSYITLKYIYLIKNYFCLYKIAAIVRFH